MKAKSRISKKNRKAKVLFALVCLILMVTTVLVVTAKGNHKKIVGYTYDTGSTVWEMAERNCPKNMDVRDFAKEIQKANGMENSVVYEYCLYKIPVYETESDYLDLNTIIGYETSDDGVLLLTNDGNGYFIEK